MTSAEKRETLWAYETRWPLEARREYKQTHPQNFAGPALALPIKTAQDVRDAEILLEQVIEPDRPKVRATIVEIATHLALSHALPKGWQETRT